MASPERLFHETWLGMVQPAEGLVVSPPVLERAQCVGRRPKAVQAQLLELCIVESEKGKKAERSGKLGKNGEEKAPPRVRSLAELLEQLLGLSPDLFDAGSALPASLSLYVPEGQQTLRPTWALRQEGVAAAAPANDASDPGEEPAPDSTPAGRAGARYAMLVWEVPAGLDLDVAETQTGPWSYPAQAKFDRLLRECRVPTGLLSNGSELRLTYAPLESASGFIPFRVADMLQSDGRPILDAFLMLLEAKRWFGVRAEDRLPAILVESRQRQAEVTNELSRQVFEALEILLAGFQAAADRDGLARAGAQTSALYRTLESEKDRVYAGLLTVLLRLVFLLYCEDHRLLPTDHELFSGHYSLLGLFEQLQQDNDRTPDSMGQRFGAYARLIALFRLVYLGGKHSGDGSGDARGGGSGPGAQPFDLPERRGELFDPNEYPFLEGWGPGGSAPVASAEGRQAVRVPTVDDGTVYRVLERLIVLDGQRLSYRSLRVEQIGGVYEALMGFAVRRLEAEAVRLRLAGSGSVRLWLEAAPLVKKKTDAERTRWLTDELGFDNAEAKKIVTAVHGCTTTREALEKLERLGGKHPERAKAGTLVLQPSLERRRTSSHYTPPELAKSVVERALEPLMATMGPAPKSESLLNLVVCEPAMGSGAFLVAACEYLAVQLTAAWAREGQQHLVGNTEEDVTLRAKRLIAQRCLIGVDKDLIAVRLARVSLWLTTVSRHEPFTFVDHSLRRGNSLIGLTLDQIRCFHWKPEPQLDFLLKPLNEAIDEALTKRRELLELARNPRVSTKRKEMLLFQANDALADIRLVGDVLVGAFFSQKTDRERERERLRRRDLVHQWRVGEDGPAKDAMRIGLETLQAELRRTQSPFHWMLEFPEVFCVERADPLDGDRPNGTAWVDSFIGNPPFAGKNSISAQGGESYSPWLQMIHPGAHGNADLCAHFFRRAQSFLGAHGTIGFIATNTISQGDTRATGLQVLVHGGMTLYNAQPDLPWPGGGAAVTVSVVHLAAGNVQHQVTRRLAGREVRALNSRLLPKPERPDPAPLMSNADFAFIGTYVLGMGFTLSPEERTELVKRDRRNAQCIFSYLGGEEVNTSPTQSHDRYVISFKQMELKEAEQWPDLIRIVRERVKPERDRLRDNADGRRRRQFWWQFGRGTPALYAAIAPLKRCLVIPQQFPNAVRVAFQPTDRTLSQKLIVVPLDTHTAFAVLQSCAHDIWIQSRCGRMGAANTPVYTPSDCFETFPFPSPRPSTIVPVLESIGETLYKSRAKYMVDTDQGLTKTYNALKNPDCNDPRILTLRALHEQLDRAVLDAYGWKDIQIPPYCPLTPADEAQLRAFKDEIIDRLFVLNAKRAAEEAVEAAAAPAPVRKRKATASPAAQTEMRTAVPAQRPLAKATPRPRTAAAPKSEPRPSKSTRPSSLPPSDAPARARKKAGARK